MTHLWLQTINGGRGDAIDPANIPPARLAAARTAIEVALANPGGIPLWARPGCTLSVTADRRKLIATIAAADGAPLVTIGVAPRDRDGAKLWPMLQQLAQQDGAARLTRRPREPWALVVAHAALLRDLDLDDGAWLPLVEAEIACAWLAILAERTNG